MISDLFFISVKNRKIYGQKDTADKVANCMQQSSFGELELTDPKQAASAALGKSEFAQPPHNRSVEAL